MSGIQQQSSSKLTDFERRARLGAGSFGEVFKLAQVNRLADGQDYVLKQVNIDGMNQKEQADAIQEVRIMASLSHPNVVRYFDSFLDGGKLNIIMEYCDGGDLQQFLKRRSSEKLFVEEETIWGIFLQIAVALHYLHSQRILHRDMKSANVFMCKDESVKIGDLGVARVLGTQTNFARTSVGTPYYLSPELCEDKPYNEKSDVWALGCILYECCTLKHPFDASNQGALILKIIQGKYDPVSVRYSKPMRKLVDGLLSRDTRYRPNVTQLLATEVCYRKLKEMGLPIPEDVEAVVAVKRKKAAAASATPAASASTPVLISSASTPVIEGGGVGPRLVSSPQLPVRAGNGVGMMKSPSGPVRAPKTPIPSSTGSAGGVSVGNNGSSAVASVPPVASAHRGDRIRRGGAPGDARAPRRVLPLSAEAKAAAAAAAAAARPVSRPVGHPRTPDPGHKPVQVIRTPGKPSPTPTGQKSSSSAISDVAALPDYVTPADVARVTVRRGGSKERVRPTVAQLAEMTQSLALKPPAPSLPNPAVRLRGEEVHNFAHIRSGSAPSAELEDLDEMMDRHLASNVKYSLPSPAPADEPTSRARSQSSPDKILAPSSEPVRPLSGNASGAVPAPKPKAKRTITVLRTALVPDEIQPEELEGMSDDFFEPVSSSSQTAGSSVPSTSVSTSRLTSDVTISTVEVSKPPALSQNIDHPDVVFLGVSGDDGYRTSLESSEAVEEGDYLVRDYSEGYEEEGDSSEYDEDEVEAEEDGGASGGAGGSLEELEEENGRLRAVLERNLESCRALLSEDVFNRIQTEIESGNELDAGSFTSDPTGYLMVYKVAHFLTQMRENEARILELTGAE